MAFVPKGEWARHLGASPRMRVTASWSGSSDPPNTSLRRENSRLWRAPLGTCCLRPYQLPVFAAGALDSHSARLRGNRRRQHKKDHDTKSYLTEIAPYKRYATTSDSTVVSLRRPDGETDDPLTAVLRSGARRLLARAIEAEADAFLATMKGVQRTDGRDRLVRHGHGPERLLQTGIGTCRMSWTCRLRSGAGRQWGR